MSSPMVGQKDRDEGREAYRVHSHFHAPNPELTGLFTTFYHLVLDVDEGAPNGQLAIVQADVVPSKPEELPTPEAGRERQSVEGAVAVVGHGRQEAAHLSWIPICDVGLRGLRPLRPIGWIPREGAFAHGFTEDPVDDPMDVVDRGRR